MRIQLKWRAIADAEDDELWHISPALYAYTHRSRILYIGKVDGSSTVRSRWEARDKDDLFEYFVRELRIDWHRCVVGAFHYDGRLTRQMVSDTESLLINALKPKGNIAAIRSRISRPGLQVHCLGVDWPHKSRRFIDS